MGRSEDYLDSLLDSLNEPNESDASELDIDSLMDEIDNSESVEEVVSEAPKKRAPDTEASYLDAFEKEISDEIGDGALDFLREFEADLGIEPDTEPISFDSSSAALASLDSSSDSSTSPALDNEEFESIDDIINSANSGVSDEVAASSDIDVSEILDNIEPVNKSENSDESENKEQAPTEQEEEEDDFISDIDDEESAPDAATEDPSPEPESEPASEGESETEGSEDISGDEILNIGDLLDSIDEEGNLSEAEMETKPGDAVDEDANSEEQEGSKDGDAPKKESDDSKEENEKEKKKPGLLAKIIAILFSTGEEKEGEEGEEAKEEEQGEPIDEEPPIDKKQAKKEEKERKKKEKEEAKKKAKEEKDKKAKEKPPKAPKQKKPKVPDKSPKIPLIAILAFVLLSASMVVLWFVAQKTISHALFINSAKSSFDHQDYMGSYEKLSGLSEYNDDDLLLYDRAKVMAMLEYRIKAYDIYVEREEHINALDALVRGSVYYNAHRREASELGIPSEYEELGRVINERLSNVYGLSEQDAKDLMALRERKNYTRELYRILERQGLWRYEKR